MSSARRDTAVCLHCYIAKSIIFAKIFKLELAQFVGICFSGSE